MTARNPTFTLDDLASDYSVLIFDTSVLLQNFGQEKKVSYENRLKVVSPIVDLLLKNSVSLLTTSQVVKEYTSESHHSRHSAVGWEIDFQIRKMVVDIFGDLGKIISLDRFESGCYTYLKKEMPQTFSSRDKKYSLSETDIDLCLSATARALFGKQKVALLSNDLGISCGLKYLKHRTGLSDAQLQSFLRIDYRLFRKVY